MQIVAGPSQIGGYAFALSNRYDASARLRFVGGECIHGGTQESTADDPQPSDMSFKPLVPLHLSSPSWKISCRKLVHIIVASAS